MPPTCSIWTFRVCVCYSMWTIIKYLGFTYFTYQIHAKFSSIFGTCRFCRHHDFLPPFNLYRPCIATAVAVVVNAVALRCNLTQGTFINVLDSFWSVIFIFITRTLQGDLRASALPWLLHTAILFSWPRKDEKSLWKALDTFGKKINVPWKIHDGLDMTTYTSLYQKQLPRVALGWERRPGWVACWFLQILCQSSLLLASWT